MKQSHRFAMCAIAALGLGAAVTAVHAHPGQGPMGGGMEQHMMGGMQHGMMGGMSPDAMQGSPAGAAAAQQLITPEERAAFIEKMRNAKTPEERQQVATANRAEMQKRAQEKGIALHEHRGPHAGAGPRSGATPQAPGATENAR